MLDKEKLKEKKAVRIRRLYIEETRALIEEGGLESLSARKLSSRIGFNIATMYNYFEDIEHLQIFAFLKYLKVYYEDLSKIPLENLNAIERYMLVLNCFAKHSFSLPKIYYSLFYGKYGDLLASTIHEYYYDIYPEELIVGDSVVRSMLLAGNIYDRELIITAPIYEEGFITKESHKMLAKYAIALHHAMLHQICISSEPHNLDTFIEDYASAVKFLLKKLKKSNAPKF